MSTTNRPAEPRPTFENRTLREKVFEHLRDEILSARLAPGTELHEVGLAQSLGVSRGPLREALGRLAAEGLVTIVPRRGAVVTKLTRRAFIEAHQVRSALETLAVRLAVPLLSDAMRERLHALNDGLRVLAAAQDAHGYATANRDFHQLFVRASGNRRLEGMHAQLLAQMGRLMMRADRDLATSIAEHDAILAAVDAGDGERAARLLEAHIATPLGRLENAVFDDEA